MSIPVPTFSDAGLSIPAESAIKAGLWAMFKAAFGASLNTSDASPQGQLVTSLAAAFGASNDLLLQYVNLIDPALSSGRMQDAIARIYYLERIGSTSTQVTCTCTGAAGTVIPRGSLAQATDGTIYASTATATIPAGGSVAVNFAALDNGPTACPAGTLTRIYRFVTGWNSITNAADGVPGRDTETPAEFEARRAASVALNASGILPSIKAAVLDTDGVTDVYVTENATGTSATIGGVSVAANSLFVSVVGGTDADVAAAIWSRKPPGCAYTGTTTVTVTDRSTGYTTPFPSYPVKFTRAAGKSIFFAVSIADNGLVPADAESQIRNAILAAFRGADGGPAAKIGATIYALRFASAVAAVGSWVQIISITVGGTASPTTASVTVNINETPTLALGHIAVSLV